MTDLRNRFASMLGDEPGPPNDLDHIVVAGRRVLRRRTAITGAAGTVGVAALTAAVVVPITTLGTRAARHPTGVSARTHPTPTPSSPCYIVKSERSRRQPTSVTVDGTTKHPKHSSRGLKEYRVVSHGGHPCTPAPGPGPATPTPTPTGSTGPGYRYSEPPSRIADRLRAHLGDQLNAWGFTVVYSRPFAQETSRLEKGHPTYFAGNDDVRVDGKLADVGLQVTHAVTTQVPFTGKCVAPRCVQTTLPDGSIEQASRMRSGTGGAMLVVVEIHHPDGLVVVAQQANYGFGPDATTARSRQPLTLAQLKDLAADPDFSF